jgi:phosphate/sulfate permease
VEGELLLLLLVAAFVGAAFAGALAFPFGWALSVLAATVGGAIGIALAGAWLAFVQRGKELR